MKALPLLALPLLLLAGETFASTLRCDKGIASEGDRTSEVLAKCGKPDSRDFIGYSENNSGRSEIQVEEWVYGPRSGGMIYFLRFEGGRLQDIESKRGN
ncbi:DUF2845 domain-containing protein [Pseudomonas cavernae]|uniref:DUF2845 domain-containing protein n=1 Tax=Pseudomonas cavernae TaxID=2320867 RepID=A0A385YZB1_9PSED|nr:DUF2845 domain-containing protein [Pseudomonas cavernae]AYC31660.1 DUF2845 domain-containing protein [Pseudomonas cavernae]